MTVLLWEWVRSAFVLLFGLAVRYWWACLALTLVIILAACWQSRREARP